MSQIQFTLDLIGIKDQKIHVHDAFVSLEQKCIGGVLLTHKIIHAILAPPEKSTLPKMCCSNTERGEIHLRHPYAQNSRSPYHPSS